MRRETAVLADYVALAAPSYRNAIMTNLLVRDLPDDVHAELQRRAAAEGQSLQRYVTRQLSRLVERPPPSPTCSPVSSATRAARWVSPSPAGPHRRSASTLIVIDASVLANVVGDG